MPERIRIGITNLVGNAAPVLFVEKEEGEEEVIKDYEDSHALIQEGVRLCQKSLDDNKLKERTVEEVRKKSKYMAVLFELMAVGMKNNAIHQSKINQNAEDILKKENK